MLFSTSSWQQLAEENPESVESTFILLKQRVMQFFADPVMWTQFFIITIKIVIIVIASRLIIRIAKKMIDHMIQQREKSPIKIDPRRTTTIGRLISNVIGYTVNFITILLIFGQLGFDLGPLLAGAGVVGLAIGFGAQSLVKDVITGFFIILEDQFAVGDVIETGNVKGTVEEIGLRVTRIKSWTGEVHIIPNGAITQVTNFSVNNSVAVVDVSVAYETDIDAAIVVITNTVERIFAEQDMMIKEPEVLGVQALGASEVIIRIVAECKPNANPVVSRVLNAEIKKALDAAGIEIPYPKMVTYQRTEKVQ